MRGVLCAMLKKTKKVTMKFLATFLLLFGVLCTGLFSPETASAGFVPCALSVDDPTTTQNETLPCTTCHFVLMGNSIIDWIMKTMVIIALVVIFAMGIIYIVSAGNEKMINMAKSGIKATLIGIVIVVSAWLIVNTVIRVLGAQDYFSGYFQNGAFTFTCDVSSTAGTARQAGYSGPGTTSGGGGFGGSGTCNPVTGSSSNPCSTSNLASTCFGGKNVDAWSAICQAESSGSITAASGTDICADGNPVSFGLFQINISAHKIGGLDCPAAFSGGAFSAKNKSCRVTNVALYNQCKAAATSRQQNIDKACELSGSGTNTGPWGAARRCKIPVKL